MVVALNFGINSAFNKGRLILGKIQQCNFICETDQDFHFPYSSGTIHRASIQIHFSSPLHGDLFLARGEALG